MKYDNKDIDDFKKVLEVSTLKEEDLNKPEYGYVLGTYLILAAQKHGIQCMTLEEADVKIYAMGDWMKLTGEYFNYLEKSKQFLLKYLAQGNLKKEEIEEVLELKDFAEENLRTFYYKHFSSVDDENISIHFVEAINAGRFYTSLFRLNVEIQIMTTKHFKKIDKHIDLRRTLKVVQNEQAYIEDVSQKIIEARSINNLPEDEQEQIYSALGEMHSRTTKLLNRRFFEMIYDAMDISRTLS